MQPLPPHHISHSFATPNAIVLTKPAQSPKLSPMRLHLRDRSTSRTRRLGKETSWHWAKAQKLEEAAVPRTRYISLEPKNLPVLLQSLDSYLVKDAAIIRGHIAGVHKKSLLDWNPISFTTRTPNDFKSSLTSFKASNRRGHLHSSCQQVRQRGKHDTKKQS